MNAPIDITGQRFGRLTVVGFSHSEGRPPRRLWLCKCDCGKSVTTKLASLRCGKTKSCGCSRRGVKHNRKPSGRPLLKGTPEYNAWLNIKSRCSKKSAKSYANYGGRGIRVHPSWINDFAAFLSHIGPRPSASHSIDRIDNDGDYEPGNVRWATRKEQTRNKRNNYRVTWRGETRTLTDWAQAVGISRSTLEYRLKHWPLDAAMTHHSRDGETL